MKWQHKPYIFPIAIFLIGLIVRAILIHVHPAIFGGDTVLRLANRDRILLAYQLPVLQTAIFLISEVTTAVLPVRYFMAVIGAASGVAFYRMAGHFIDPGKAFWAALLLVTNPFLIQLSIVPYQEVLMLLFLLLAFHFYFEGRMLASGVCLGISCLTRYEAWAACPVLVVAYTRHRGLNFRAMVSAVLLFAWAPIAWVAANHGLSAGGTFVVEAPRSMERLVRFVYLGWITVRNTPAPVLILSFAGFWSMYGRRRWTDARIRVLAAFFGLFLIAVLFSAHGEAPNPERFVTAREATLIITAAIFSASFAIDWRPRIAVVLSIAASVLGIYDAHRFIARDTSKPEVQLSLELAQFIDEHVSDHEPVVVLTAPIPRPLVQDYLDKANELGGAAGLARARSILSSMNTSPPDYQRTLVHSGRTSESLLSLSTTPFVERQAVENVPADLWVALWSNFEPTNEPEARIHRAVRSQPALYVLRRGGLSVSIHRLLGRS